MVFESDWKVISKAPHFKERTIETRIDQDENASSALNGPLCHVHDHIATLERALYDEVDRRITSENQFREQIEAKMRIATQNLSDVAETEMARMYRRIEADVMNRLESLSIDVRKISSTVSKLSRQLDSVTAESQDNRERILRLEKRFGLMIEGSEPQNAAQSKDLNKLRETAKNEVEMTKRVNDLTELVSGRVLARIDAIEDWLQGNLTPEILRITDAIKAEQLKREEHDGEIMAVVRQYSDIMTKHFDAERIAAAAEPVESQLLDPPTSGEDPRGGRQTRDIEQQMSRRPSLHDKSVGSRLTSRRSSVHEQVSHNSSRLASARDAKRSPRTDLDTVAVPQPQVPDDGTESTPTQSPGARGFLRRGGRLELNEAIRESN